MKALIIPPAWHVGDVTSPLEFFLRQRGCVTHTVQYRGHNGDVQKNLIGASLSDYLDDSLQSLAELEKEGNKGDKPYLIGLSMGGVIGYELARMWPERHKRFSGLMMYGSPGHGFIPYFSTLKKILFTRRYRQAIFARRKGILNLYPRDIEGLLFGGKPNAMTSTIATQGESGLALFQMLISPMSAESPIEIPLSVTRCSGELFHRNSEAERWAARAGATYDEFEGSHFGVLSHEPFHKMTHKVIKTAAA